MGGMVSSILKAGGGEETDQRGEDLPLPLPTTVRFGLSRFSTIKISVEKGMSKMVILIRHYSFCLIDYEETPLFFIVPAPHCRWAKRFVFPHISKVFCTFVTFFIVLLPHAFGPSALSFLVFEHPMPSGPALCLLSCSNVGQVNK